jgi:hypothetical protein
VECEVFDTERSLVEEEEEEEEEEVSMHESSGRDRLESWRGAPRWCIVEEEDVVGGECVDWTMFEDSAGLAPARGHCQSPLQCLILVSRGEYEV